MDITAFEQALAEHRPAIVRFVRYRLTDRSDWEDVLQDVLLTAFQQHHTLRDASAFKPWLIRIARNKCNDYYRSLARHKEVPLEDTMATAVSPGPEDTLEQHVVQEALAALSPNDRQILTLYYLGQQPQRHIAQTLGIPLGTVKSRLHNARQAFRQLYPLPHATKGAPLMDNTHFCFPERQPPHTITPLSTPPAAIRLEELPGWFLVPRLGEHADWAIYDHPAATLTETYSLAVTGTAKVHDVPGVAISVITRTSQQESSAQPSRWFVAQLTPTHCRYLSEMHKEDGVAVLRTFLDSDDFLTDWGLGPDNCGRPVDIVPAGRIVRNGTSLTVSGDLPASDIVGSYRLTIGERTFDTVLLMEIESDGIATEQYVNSAGRTLLWRRFNRDDWRKEQYGKPWSEQLPSNEQLIINGTTYVHWYDCLTDQAFC